MKLLLRKITYDSTGVPEYVDTEVARDDIVIGSSPQSDIQLLDSGIAGDHARFTRKGKELRLVAEKGQSFVCNGKTCRQATVTEGDEILIGAQMFTCSAAPPGFDLALEWQQVELTGDALADAYRTSLNQLNFSPRKASWLLAVLVLLLGLTPLVNHFWPGDESTDGLPPQGIAIQKIWQSGPLLPAHQVAIGNDCAVCHQKPFVQVEDKACQQCHSSVVDHVPPGHPELEDPAMSAALEAYACQDCHKEHNEPESIVSRSDGLCVDCHGQMRPGVEGFSLEAHPEFALSLLRPVIEGEGGARTVDWQPEKVRLGEAGDFDGADEGEISHLKYPHDIHLDPEAVKHPQRGDALQCADCHSLSPDREHFEPITMEAHCASCHELSFDPSNPQKQLPHGSPEAVFEVLEAHFVKRAFGPEPVGAFERRRRPGRERAEEGCDQDYDCARQQALEETGRQFSQRGCVTCHQVSEIEGTEGPERWQVLPVKINDDWYADARFDHQSHLTQSHQSGDSLCLTCHNADTSGESSDVLMPGIAQCTDCHGDKAHTDRVALDCVSCHDYHRLSAADHSEGMERLMKGVTHGDP
jgi:predicted CXXCH cytochrome family protein